MIKNFLSKMAEDIYHGVDSKHSRRLNPKLRQTAKHKLKKLNNTTKLATLRRSPNNQLRKLKENLSEFWSIKISEQWTIIFKWDARTSSAYDVHLI